MGPPLVLILELHFSNHLKIPKKLKKHDFRQFSTTFGGPGDRALVILANIMPLLPPRALSPGPPKVVKNCRKSGFLYFF